MIGTPAHVILSRTDSIGDVMLTLPMAGLLRQHFPGVRITFLARRYTEPVLRCSHHVDQIITLEELQAGDAVRALRALDADVFVHVFPHKELARWAHQARIPMRIGTAHRWWHWTNCNVRVRFTRKRSDLHEAQLNTRLLAPFGMEDPPTLSVLAAHAGFNAPVPDGSVRALLRADRRTVIIHPHSKGSAVEWGLDRFARLVEMMDPDRYQVVVTGTSAEATNYRTALPLDMPHVIDAGGAFDLKELISLIGASQALVAASTGPLHIAAACGIKAIGLYATQRPIHPGRWAPIGSDAHALTAPDAPELADPKAQIHAIRPEAVLKHLSELP